MSRSGSVSLDWADGTHEFRLAWGQIIELQEKCDAGPLVLLQRFGDNSWRIENISETLRLGLIGGGMEPAKALALVRRYVMDRPPMENVLFAQAVLQAGLLGTPDEEVVKKKAEPSGSMNSPTGNSGSLPSSEPAPRSE